MLCSAIRGHTPDTRVPLACGLCLRYSPEVSDPDATGRRHRVLPLAFREDLGDGRTVPLCDPTGRELGRAEVVDTPGGLRVEVFDESLLKAIKRGNLPMGLAAKWHAGASYAEYGVTITTRATLAAVTLTADPLFDAAELRIMR